MDSPCFKGFVVAFIMSCVRAQECGPMYSFDVGPYTYHLVMDCIESLSMATEMCTTLNGSLALIRSQEVIEIISDFVFDNDISVITVSDPLIDTSGSDITTSTTTTAAPVPVPPQADDGNDSSGSSGSGSRKKRRKRSIDTTYSVYTLWVASFFTFPYGGPDRSKTCVTVSFWKYQGLTEFRLSMSNDCDPSGSDHLFPWVCESMSENYEPEALGVVPRTRVEQTMMDNRPSAIFVGTSGIVLVAVAFLCILILDISQLVQAFRHLLKARRIAAIEQGRYRATSPSLTDISSTSLPSSCSLNDMAEYIQ